MTAVLAQLLGTPELLLIGLIVLVLFGATKIPEIARSLGRAKSEYQKAVQEGEAEVAAKSAKPAAAPEGDEKTLKAARELGIPTDGRSIDDIKADIRRKMA